MPDLPNHSRRSWLFGRSIFRVGVAIVLISAGYVLLSLYFLTSYTDRLLDVRKAELQRIVDLGLASLDPLRDDEAIDSMGLSIEQLRRNGAITLRDMTYRYRLGENYLFMITLDGLVLVQPFEREIEYTNQYDLTDEHGTPFIQEMIEVASSGDREGFVEYWYIRPGGTRPERKIAYVVGIPEWGVLIGAGMYMGNIEADNRAYFTNSLLLALGLLLLILLTIWIALRPTAASYRVLLDLFDQVRQEPDTQPPVPVQDFRTGSEAWQLLHDFQGMLDQIARHKHAHQQAALAERNRLARELHDAVSQSLFSAGLIADVLPTLIKKQPDQALEKIKTLGELTRGAHAELRTLLIDLRPERLVKANLDELIRQLAQATAGRYQLPVKTQIEACEALPADVKIALYRICQEALNNAAKHANASLVTIRLTGSDDILSLTIGDDGQGFDPAQISDASFGLSIMRERAAAIGASLSVNTAEHQGTVIRVTYRMNT